MRTILAACAMFLSAFVMNANNVYCFDFESQATSPSEYREAYYIIAGPEVVSNPMKNGINTSEKVLFFTSQYCRLGWVECLVERLYHHRQCSLFVYEGACRARCSL